MDFDDELKEVLTVGGIRSPDLLNRVRTIVKQEVEQREQEAERRGIDAAIAIASDTAAAVLSVVVPLFKEKRENQNGSDDGEVPEHQHIYVGAQCTICGHTPFIGAAPDDYSADYNVNPPPSSCGEPDCACTCRHYHSPSNPNRLIPSSADCPLHAEG